MRLLHITHQYRPAIGGAEQYITNLSEELAGRGHQIDVFTTHSVGSHSWQGQLPSFERLDGVNVYRFASLPRGKRTWRILRFGFEHYWPAQARRYEPFIFFGSGPVSAGLFAAVTRRARRYDLIHINQLHYSHSLTAYAAARLSKVPVVITPHIHPAQRETFDVGYMRAILSGADGVFAVTPPEKIFLQAQELAANITVGGNSLRLRNFPPLESQACRAQLKLPSDGFLMLFLGRKTDYKGLDKCLEAYQAIRRKRSDISFVAIGPETDFSRRLWEQYRGLAGVFVFDAVSDQERLAGLAACDVLVLPSLAEAFGIVYLEAWAYGKPVIGTDLPPVNSLIDHGHNGLLVNPQQEGEIAEAIERLADNSMLACELGEQGRVKLERRYTVEHIADVVEGNYVRVIRQRRNRLKKGMPCASA